MPTQSDVKTSSPALIAAAWIVVILPAAWGLRYTVENALKLFHPTPVTAAAPVMPTH